VVIGLGVATSAVLISCGLGASALILISWLGCNIVPKVALFNFNN
jgi:hypothetical protein